MPRTVGQFVEGMAKAAAALEAAPDAVALAGAAVLDASATAEVASHTVGMRLRGVGRSGASVGVRTVPLSHGGAIVKATGPLHLMDNPTRRHVVEARRGAALKLPDGRYRRRVVVKGTEGKGTFRKGIVAGLPAAEEAMAAASNAVVLGALR